MFHFLSRPGALLGVAAIGLAGVITAWAALKISPLPASLQPLQKLQWEELRHTYGGSQRLLLDRRGEVINLTSPEKSDSSARAGTHIKSLRRSETQLPWLPLAEFGTLPAALLEAEDRRFLEHDGVDYRALASALWAQISRQQRGGSTISMQLARQLVPSSALPRTWRGKLLQVRAAWALERYLSKAQILEAYLNLVPLRGDVRGLHTAAALFLGVSKTAHLSPAQQTWLLAMIPAPQAAADKLAARACRMWTRNSPAGKCEANLPDTQEALAQARLRRIVIAGQVFASGQATSLDAPTQRIAHHALTQLLSDLQTTGATDASAIVLDNASGEVRAYASLSLVQMAGKTHIVSIRDLAQEPRQSGSILKPLLYAQALSAGAITQQTWLPTVSTSFAPYVAGEKPYRPRYNGHGIGSRVLPREALGGSLNMPAVHVLSKLGVQNFSRHLSTLGLMSYETAQRAGLSLALGSAETQLLPLTQAYRCLANDGQAGFCILTAQATRAVTSYLSDPEPRNRAFGAANALNTPFASAVKTGTSNQARDSWAVGYTKEHTVGVWLGRRDGRAMSDIYGPGGAGRGWRLIMEELERSKPR